ncbi:MAG TPA: lipid-binding SYLF domain-containing protein [Candidatus Eisenbacteria bacterium]|nr:lipid-binding SYLF domain-containing protein [Candidatus Eisenbacteria bacterium]
MKYIFTLGVVAVVLAAVSLAVAENNESSINKRIATSANVLSQVMDTPDHAIPDKILDRAKCIAVVPSLVKIAVGFGGQHGHGVASCRTANGWSAPLPIDITGGSWGLQLGGEATDLVLVFMGDRGVEHLVSDHFKIGGDASAAAGPVGRNAGADTDVEMKDKILTYSRSRGLFAGVDLSGTVVKQDRDETALLFGHMETPNAILTGKVSPPAASQPLLSELRKISENAHERVAMR